ncbi:Uncharacterised protein [Chlamydia abortus]|uniref:YjfB family protein n=1 Tax=Paenibacillus residui TaxID=629724 RepID=A0ABW3DC23_9BACL|nr:Uncharacterised protein [Chlamydia abortus]
MDIAALSIVLSQASLSQSVGIRLLSMSKDQAEQQGQTISQMMETTSIHPDLGHKLDIRI